MYITSREKRSTADRPIYTDTGAASEASVRSLTPGEEPWKVLLRYKIE